jgi:hypothetical protein
MEDRKKKIRSNNRVIIQNVQKRINTPRNVVQQNKKRENILQQALQEVNINQLKIEKTKKFLEEAEKQRE